MAGQSLDLLSPFWKTQATQYIQSYWQVAKPIPAALNHLPVETSARKALEPWRGRWGPWCQFSFFPSWHGVNGGFLGPRDETVAVTVQQHVHHWTILNRRFLGNSTILVPGSFLPDIGGTGTPDFCCPVVLLGICTTLCLAVLVVTWLCSMCIKLRDCNPFLFALLKPWIGQYHADFRLDPTYNVHSKDSKD